MRLACVLVSTSGYGVLISIPTSQLVMSRQVEMWRVLFRRAGPEEGEVSPPHRPGRGQDRQAGGSRNTRFTFVEITNYENFCVYTNY